MNPPRVRDRDDIAFLIGTPREASAGEAARVRPPAPNAPAHDAGTRPLARRDPDPDAFRHEVRPHVRRADRTLVVDDTVPDKPYARKTGPVGPLRSGTQHRVLRGIDPVTLARTDGDAVYPTGCRLADPAEAPKRNEGEHVREVPVTAKAGGFTPRHVCFDSWQSAREDREAGRGRGGYVLTQVRSNRRVDPDRTGNRSSPDCAIAAAGTVVHVRRFGFVNAFRLVAPGGDTEHWIANDLGMDDLTRLTCAERAWAIEEYHRGRKQCTEVERCPARPARSRRSHIGVALRAFVRLEWHRSRSGVRRFEARWDLIRDAVRAYPRQPSLQPPRYGNCASPI